MPRYVYKAGALLGQDGWCRTLPGEAAFARQVYGYFEHFTPGKLASTTAYDGFTVTQITATSAGTLVMADAAGGWLNLTGGTHDGSGIQMQSMGELFLPAAGKEIWVEASIKLADADDIDWFVGLAKLDTNIFSTQPAGLIGFAGDDGDANLDFQVRASGTGNAADTTVDMANTTAKRIGFYVNGVTSVTPYIDGVAYTAVTTNIPTEELAITFGMLNGATTGNNTLGLDWVRYLATV